MSICYICQYIVVDGVVTLIVVGVVTLIVVAVDIACVSRVAVSIITVVIVDVGIPVVVKIDIVNVSIVFIGAIAPHPSSLAVLSLPMMVFIMLYDYFCLIIVFLSLVLSSSRPYQKLNVPINLNSCYEDFFSFYEFVHKKY